MKTTLWTPFQELEDLFSNYNRRSSLSGSQADSSDRHRLANWSPKADIVETEKEFLIKVELPEVQKDDVKVTVNEGVLNISGERKSESEEKNKIMHRIERFYGRFDRSFTLPTNANGDDIEATFKDGILSLHIKKNEQRKPKLIEVTAGN